MKIAVIGTGYVGLVSAACFAEWGHEVVGADKDSEKIAGLKCGKLPIFEPGLDILVQRNVADCRLSFTTDVSQAIRGANIVVIAVGTPARPRDGEADLSFVYAAAKEIAGSIDGFTVVVTKSTVPVGTGDEIERIIRRTRPDARFTVASNPEFLREGRAIGDFQNPDRVVIGTQSDDARKLLEQLYLPLSSRGVPILVTGRRTAELIKYASNAFLAVKISYINEMADLCERVGSDVAEVAFGMGLDSRIGAEFLNAGPGYGGSCFPKDTLALLRTAQDHGVPMRIVQETVMVNDARKRGMALKVMDALGRDIEGQRIAILGLTFKPDTDDVRESPSIPLIEALQRAGAHICAHDPEGMPRCRTLLENVAFFDDPYDCVQGADAAVLVTDWGSLRTLDLAEVGRRMRQRILIDFRNVFDKAVVEELGFSLTSIGRPMRMSGKLRADAAAATRLAEISYIATVESLTDNKFISRPNNFEFSLPSEYLE